MAAILSGWELCDPQVLIGGVAPCKPVTVTTSSLVCTTGAILGAAMADYWLSSSLPPVTSDVWNYTSRGCLTLKTTWLKACLLFRLSSVSVQRPLDLELLN